MDFLIFCHLRLPGIDLLLDCLQQCSGIPLVKTETRTDDILDKILIDVEADPDYLVANQSNERWVSVECNSFKRLHQWGRYLSDTLHTCFIQTMYCSLNEYTYFLAYDKGVKLREIEGTAQSLIPLINEGEAFAFEGKDSQGEQVTPELKMFDLDSLACICMQLGFDLSRLQINEESVVLDGGRKGETMYNVSREMKKVLWRLEASLRNR